MHPVTGWLLALALAANGVLGVVTFTQHEAIDELTRVQDELQRDIEDTAAAIEGIDSQFGDLLSSAQAGARGLADILTELASEVEGVQANMESLESRVQSIEFQIEKPPGCFGGDAVYWALGLQSGFTC